MHEINEVMNEFVAPVFGGLRIEPRFRRAIEDNDGEGEPEPAEARKKGHREKEIREVKKVKEGKDAE